MSKKKLLVTGGAGYVGSHTAALLLEAGHELVVLDDLSTGHRAAVPSGAELIELTLADAAGVDRLFGERRFDAIVHFAARSLVPESMRDPLAYLGDNVQNAVNLLRAAIRHDVRQLVLSSTANLFGASDVQPIDERAAIDPGSPYGESKHIIERMLLWLERTRGLRYATLRYFNAAGADPSGARGEDHSPETHLIPIVLGVALGQRSHVELYGDDYPTPDGSCVRDYVHVWDLAQAHLLALGALEHQSLELNLGSGKGSSVLEVIDVARRVTRRPIDVVVAPRRPGDPAVLVASSERARQLLGWAPRYTDLQSIVETAWRWHASHPRGYDER
jgi:UDP-glucose 4-epimerase